VSFGTGISWREILKREFELCDTGNITTPPPGGCAWPCGTGMLAHGSVLVQLRRRGGSGSVSG